RHAPVLVVRRLDAGADDDLVVHDQGRTGHAPADDLRAVVVNDVHRPLPGPGPAVQTNQVSKGSERVDVAVGDGRRGPRAVAAHVLRLAEAGLVLVLPALPARGLVV